MAEASAMNSVNKVEQSDAVQVSSIKKEVDELVKREPVDCMLCVARSLDVYDVHNASTATSKVSLSVFLFKFTQVDVSTLSSGTKFVCKVCFDLINVLELAEIEYNKLKEAFEAILSKNPLFESSPRVIKLDTIKLEFNDANCIQNVDDSDEEPLVKKKRRNRKLDTSKKKNSVSKRKLRSRNNVKSWTSDDCAVDGDANSLKVETEDESKALTVDADPAVLDVKVEDSVDGSQSPYDDFAIPSFDNIDDDDSSSLPDVYLNGRKERKKVGRKPKIVGSQTVKKKTKEIHQCDQCPAKYTSLTRLEQHKQKHDGSKPPYICEVCGAHYKHKRACDIHIKLHKGISDWKCEECNRLFPSKNALQRHNNIHTGKLNYQCDLCGKSFIHTSSFKMHKLSHSGVKPHACDVCGLALMTRSHLKRHKRVHSGEKRHQCGVCGKRFSERYNLIAHSRSHDAQQALALPPQPKRRLFRCAFCAERFERRAQLERHAAAAHGRTLERPPPTPRNTMSKLLKGQAQAKAAAETETKDERSPEPPLGSVVPQKLLAQLSSSSIITSSSWSGAYAAEFGLRHDYSH